MKQHIYNHPNRPLRISTLGAATSRFQSLLHLQDGRLALPVTVSLVLYDSLALKELWRKQTNESVIYGLNQDEDYIYTIGYAGDITKIHKQTLETVQQINHNIGNHCRWTSILDGLIAVTAEKSHSKGCIQILDLQTLQQKRLFDGQYTYGCLVKRNNLTRYYVLKEVKSKRLSKEEKAKLTQAQRRKLSQAKKYVYTLEIHDDESLLKSMPFPNTDQDIINLAQSDHHIAYIGSDRTCTVISIKDDSLYSLKLEGNGAIQATTIFNNELYFYIKSRNFGVLDLNTRQCRVVQIKEISEQPYGFIIKQDFSLFTSEAYIVVQRGETVRKREFGGLTKAGIDFLDDKTIVSGDFSGNAVINYDFDFEKTTLIPAGSSVRCVACQNGVIYLGTMEGHILSYKNGLLGEFSATVSGSVTCIRLFKDMLLASTTHGKMVLFESGKRTLDFLAHPPQARSELFGSLDQYADIWSCIWSPDGVNFATASEDQTVKVFHREKELVTLKGHQLAVTCLDWQDHNGKRILYSCSDDRTVRMYNSEFELVHMINTYFVNEWLTLTYMCVREGKIAIGAQNGYFFLYSIDEGRYLFADKLHMGGIEGLAWRGKRIATCSSDEAINVIEL